MPDKDVSAQINKFIEVFHSYTCSVSLIDFGRDTERYRKTLYFTILEALSKARYPTSRPGAAFSKFVNTCGGWTEGDKVSLPHLVAALERTADSAFNDLRQFAYRELKQWGSGGPMWIDRDIDKAEIQRRWPKDTNGSVRRIPELNFDWTALQHRKLLYSYRSKLSHESRQPTVSFEQSSDQLPYYESVQNLSGSETVWHLVYPSAFLFAACQSGIKGLKNWLIAKCKDPYQQFQFGRFLVDKLNDPNIAVHNPFS